MSHLVRVVFAAMVLCGAGGALAQAAPPIRCGR